MDSRKGYCNFVNVSDFWQFLRPATTAAKCTKVPETEKEQNIFLYNVTTQLCDYFGIGDVSNVPYIENHTIILLIEKLGQIYDKIPCQLVKKSDCIAISSSSNMSDATGTEESAAKSPKYLIYEGVPFLDDIETLAQFYGELMSGHWISIKFLVLRFIIRLAKDIMVTEFTGYNYLSKIQKLIESENMCTTVKSTILDCLLMSPNVNVLKWIVNLSWFSGDKQNAIIHRLIDHELRLENADAAKQLTVEHLVTASGQSDALETAVSKIVEFHTNKCEIGLAINTMDYFLSSGTKTWTKLSKNIFTYYFEQNLFADAEYIITKMFKNDDSLPCQDVVCLLVDSLLSLERFEEAKGVVTRHTQINSVFRNAQLFKIQDKYIKNATKFANLSINTTHVTLPLSSSNEDNVYVNKKSVWGVCTLCNVNDKDCIYIPCSHVFSCLKCIENAISKSASKSVKCPKCAIKIEIILPVRF